MKLYETNLNVALWRKNLISQIEKGEKMKIIIAGDGEVGFHLAKIVSESGHHDITIVDPHEELLKMVESYTDLMTIAGESTSISVLERANIKKADLLISVLHDESINIITCILGKKLGAKRCISRVNNTEYLTERNKEIFKSLGVDFMVGPERIASREIVRLLRQTAATETFDFSDRKLSLFLIRLDEDASVINHSLDEIAHMHPHLDFRAVAIHRNSRTIIPRGADRFLVGDMAYVITRPEGINQLIKLGGKEQIDIKNAMIIGGGRIGRKTARALEKTINVKLIEIDKERCKSIADGLERTLVINGDASDVKLLEEEGIRDIDAFIAVTNNTETNIFACLLAKKYGVKKIIPLVENVDYIDIAQTIGIDTVINKKLITASYIARFTMGAEVSSLKCLNGVDAEVMEFIVKPGVPITQAPIRNIKMPKDAIIGGVIRNHKGYIAIGDFQIEEKDKVVVFSLPKAISKVEKLFK